MIIFDFRRRQWRGGGKVSSRGAAVFGAVPPIARERSLDSSGAVGPPLPTGGQGSCGRPPQKQGLGGCRRREQRPAERQGRIVCGDHDHGLGPVGEEDPGAFVPRLHRRPDVRGRIIMQPRWAGSNAATPSGYEMACFVVLKCDLGNRHRPLADLSARPDRIPDLAVILIYLTYLMF